MLLELAKFCRRCDENLTLSFYRQSDFHKTRRLRLARRDTI